jgi:hypothetical protein
MTKDCETIMAFPAQTSETPVLSTKHPATLPKG